MLIMKIDFDDIYNLSQKIFTLIKSEYSIYLNKDKLKFLNDLDVHKFYKIVNDKEMDKIFYLGDICYINEYYDINILEMVPFFCLASLVSNLNPLKIGLIEQELKYLNDKYQLNILPHFKNELEVASLVSKTLLNNVPFKIIFKESDADIVQYLTEEIGSQKALYYSSISKIMKEKTYSLFEENTNYDEIIDNLYEYVSNKSR